MSAIALFAASTPAREAACAQPTVLAPPASPSIWRAPDGTNPSGSAGQARAHLCGRSSPSLPITPPSHVGSLAEGYRILLASTPHAAIATMAPLQVRSASPQNQAT